MSPSRDSTPPSQVEASSLPTTPEPLPKDAVADAVAPESPDTPDLSRSRQAPPYSSTSRLAVIGKKMNRSKIRSRRSLVDTLKQLERDATEIADTGRMFLDIVCTNRMISKELDEIKKEMVCKDRDAMVEARALLVLQQENAELRGTVARLETRVRELEGLPSPPVGNGVTPVDARMGSSGYVYYALEEMDPFPRASSHALASGAFATGHSVVAH